MRLWGFLLFFAPAVAIAQDPVYVPTDEAASAITVVEAKRVISTLTNGNWVVPAWWGNPKTRVTAVSIDDEQIVIEHTERRRGRSEGTGKVTLKLEQMPKLEVLRRPELGIYFDRDRETALGVMGRWDLKDDLVRMANALHAMRLHAVNAKRQDAEFVRIAGEYRAAAQKPALSEEARRLKVQAEFMIREKRFAEAASLYEEALKTAPWWADGHYNRALVLAELKRHAQAARQMKRYLLLEPDSPNARAVQDQIYQWEAAGAGERK